MKKATSCLHSGYTPKNGEPGVPPIVQSTTYRFDSTAEIAGLFDMPTAHLYSRFSNPTTDCVEKKVAELEGGVAAMCTSSGQSATLLSVLNVCSAGDSLLCSTSIYGGSINLLSVTLKRFGIESIFFDQEMDSKDISALIKDNTKCIFAETLSNPTLKVLDIEKIAEVAHSKNIPLIVDNTFPTPILCKPIEHGADIVVHSTSKYMDGHAVQVGGIIVDGGKFNWNNGKFPDFCTADESYHGVVYTRDFGAAAYIVKARMQLMRDFGCYPSAHSSFLLNMGLETLDVRMQRYCENTIKVAEYLKSNDVIESVSYPALKEDSQYELAQKYLKNGCSGVLAVNIRGNREQIELFCDSLKLVSREVHVADIRSCILHPASTTHRQLTDEQLKKSGITVGLVRLSIGLEDPDDIIDDLSQALGNIISA